MAVKPEVSEDRRVVWEQRQILFLSSILTWCILEWRIESLVYDQNFYGEGAEVVDGGGEGGD